MKNVIINANQLRNSINELLIHTTDKIYCALMYFIYAIETNSIDIKSFFVVAKRTI